MSNYTPGPWFIDDRRNMGVGIAIGSWHPEVGQVTHAEVRDGCDEAGELGDMDANAHLIAAAPELYEALYNLASLAAPMLASSDDTEPGQVALQQAQNALSKAQGVDK